MSYTMKNQIGLMLMLLGVQAYSQAIPDFTLTNVVDGQPVSLSEFRNCTGLVLVFTSNECPYDGYYRDRLRALVNRHLGKIQFVFINSIAGEAESAERMKSAYKLWNIPVPYLDDKQQTAMNCVGATRSPEVFLLKNDNGSFLQVYKGAIDDNPQVAGDVRQRYLEAGIEQLVSAGKVTLPSTRAVGCVIRKN